MKLDCKYVSAEVGGDAIFQIVMEAERDQEDGPYILLQRAFLEEMEDDDPPCYVETHETRLTGHYRDVDAELTRHQLTVKLPPPVNETIEANFTASDEDFERIRKMLKRIVR